MSTETAHRKPPDNAYSTPHGLLITEQGVRGLLFIQNRRFLFKCARWSYTYYDGCFLRVFATVPTWQALHRAVARCVATAERQLGAPRSHPHAFFGLWMAEAPIPPP